jgi:subtilisin-like proprotein convertase family protein
MKYFYVAAVMTLSTMVLAMESPIAKKTKRTKKVVWDIQNNQQKPIILKLIKRVGKKNTYRIEQKATVSVKLSSAYTNDIIIELFNPQIQKIFSKSLSYEQLKKDTTLFPCWIVDDSYQPKLATHVPEEHDYPSDYENDTLLDATI